MNKMKILFQFVHSAIASVLSAFGFGLIIPSFPSKSQCFPDTDSGFCVRSIVFDQTG